MSRYSEEALSRILGEHAAGHLVPGGAMRWAHYTDDTQVYPRSCPNQAAFNEPTVFRAAHRCLAVALWFDHEYDPTMSAEELLGALDDQARRRVHRRNALPSEDLVNAGPSKEGRR